MVGVFEIDHGLFADARQAGFHVDGQLGFGLQHIQLNQQGEVPFDQRSVTAQFSSEGAQDAVDFRALIVAQHFQFVVERDVFLRFNVGEGALLGGAQRHARHLTLVRAFDGQQTAVVQEGFLGVAQPSLIAVMFEDLVEVPCNHPAHPRHVGADGGQLGRSIVTHFAMAVKDLVDGLGDVGGVVHVLQQSFQPGELPFAALEELEHIVDCVGRVVDAHEALLAQHAVGHVQQFQVLVELFKLHARKAVPFAANGVKFMYPFELGAQVLEGTDGPQIHHAVARSLAAAQVVQHEPDEVKFQVGGRLGVEVLQSRCSRVLQRKTERACFHDRFVHGLFTGPVAGRARDRWLRARSCQTTGSRDRVAAR